ncbi:mechanosensitive ion channel [Thalassotalea sp. LPB0316]|uniref:mechanosensitive ion channel family protein n=1 Tax=Thalassotalea sp. LPB0316 TaxID=2769490 RepID=UPI001867B55A|nr:mechanosensitive ion channel domain-containing protein [Thalassotalea sp. LPB0316]QOL26691.1 mechanosensitive ion channel [Thalassotalea sp. LPB0316]
MLSISRWVIFFSLFCSSFVLIAKEQSDVSLKELLNKPETTISQDSATQADDVVLDDYQRGQPQSSLSGFLSALQQYDYELATHYMDFRNLSPDTKAIAPEELAKMFHVVLRRTIWIDTTAISEEPLGNLQDGLPSYRELFGTIATPSGDVRLYLQRIPRASDKARIWKISNATVDKIPYLSQQYAYSEFGEWLSEHTPNYDFLGVELWQWLYFSAALIFYYFVSLLITWLVSKGISRVRPNTHQEFYRFLRGPVTILLTIELSRLFVAQSNITIAVQAIMDGATLLVFAWIWLFVRLIDLFNIKLKARFLAQDKPLAIYLLRPASTVAKIIVVITGLLLWFENLGFSATTLLAGLGIGGLAIALAAQKTVENIIGAITLYTSAPVKVGHVCRFGNVFGVVEEIGLRATRIRTLDRTVIHIANAQFVDLQLENISEREKIAYRPEIILKPSASAQQIEQLLSQIKNLLIAHPEIADEPLRVVFKGFSLQGLQLDILAYVSTTDYDQYLAVTNELNLALTSALADCHCELANIQMVDGQA